MPARLTTIVLIHRAVLRVAEAYQAAILPETHRAAQLAPTPRTAALPNRKAVSDPRLALPILTMPSLTIIQKICTTITLMTSGIMRIPKTIGRRIRMTDSPIVE